MTPRARKKPLLPMPPHTCQHPGCGQEYPSIGDFADTDRAALLGGWVYRAGQWSCPGHRDLIPWWPGPARPVLPARVPGVTRRAEVIGLPVAAIENVPRPGRIPVLENLPDVSADAGPGHPDDGLEPLSPLPGYSEHDARDGLEPLPPLPERVPQATVAAWQAAIRDQLNEKALADGEPLESLAPEPEENETQT